jgi:alkylation response protein AidB-like acyl-CoA dehydrogenase
MSAAAAADPPDLEAFRGEVRAFLAANCPAPPGFKMPQTFLEVESEPQLEYLRRWQRTLYEAGYLGFDVPVEYGGRGVDPGRARVVAEEMSRARAPFLVNMIGLAWAGPTILTYGTEAQKKRHLPGILSAEEIWCQGFSEPAAGSDLASLATRAVRSGDGYRVTGHKVWTTLAHFSKWMILLARTDPALPKHAGLSYFLFPMDAPGVTVQPLVKMTGEGGFNQVLFDDAPMPADCLLGREGQGWEVAMTTLLFERGAAERSSRERASGFVAAFDRLVALARRTKRAGRPVTEDPWIRDRLVQLGIQVQAMAASAERSLVPELNTERPLALPLMSKLVSSELNQEMAELACDVVGDDAALWLGDPHAPDGAEWPRAFMNSFGLTIGGGTSEVLRNILGERVLGLPKSK